MDWETLLADEKKKPYFLGILNFLAQQRSLGKHVYPAQSDIFNAIKTTAFSDIKIVIIGQDPYHNPNQAHGLAFSVQRGIKPPPSLMNIFKELQSDCGITIPTHGCLESWAQQGVLLLNTVLTVEENKPHSHANIGWEKFTDTIIEKINDHPEKIIYLLWGSHAQKKANFIDTKKHVILTAPHPSPLSAHRGFLGCKHFSKANAFLKKTGSTSIDWQI